MIIGIGLSKTGLTSLTAAMEILGFQSKRYLRPHEMLQIESYDFVCDLPIPVVYRTLDEEFPNSKFIYTGRSTKTWIASIRNHFEKRPPSILDDEERMYREQAFGGVEFEEQRFLDVYNQHRKAAREYFAERPGDVLFVDIESGDGWREICSFLDVEVPSAKFPHENRGNYGQPSPLPGKGPKFLSRARRVARAILKGWQS